jgi:hypothetical protein
VKDVIKNFQTLLRTAFFRSFNASFIAVVPKILSASDMRDSKPMSLIGRP